MSKVGNSQWFVHKANAKTLLLCGHWVKVVHQPHFGAKLGCTAGLGCGYNFPWIEFVDENGRVTFNREVKR